MLESTGNTGVPEVQIGVVTASAEMRSVSSLYDLLLTAVVADSMRFRPMRD